MGCDIHVFPEFSDFKNPDGSDYWSLVCKDFYVGRDYKLFGVLAGVRDGSAVFSPRGVPKDASMQTRFENELFVVDSEAPDEGCCTRNDAERWGGYVDEKKGRVYHPDWHSHSWLTTEELQKCLEEYVSDNGHEPCGRVYALLAMMNELEERGNKTRIVFWFDN